MLSVVCVFPYVLTLHGDALSKVGVPIEIILAVQLVQCLILFSIAIFFGLLLAKKINFRIPLLEALLEKGDYKKILKNILGISVLLGIAVAIVIYALDAFFTAGGADISTHESLAPAWQKLLASFYGGITEEVLLRLFLMTLFIFLGMKLSRKKEPTKIIVVASIILAAVIFGLGHLPITAAVTKVTPLVIGRAIILNGVGGVVFGWLFWKKGLESAMIAHFTTDVFLLTLLPLVCSAASIDFQP